jgi:hypothetical protein
VQIREQEYELIPVTALRPHPRNPRKGDTVAIADSIVNNKFYGAVIAQRSTGYILAGNHRYKAAIDTGADEIPVIWVECTDEEALRILLVDNRTNDKATYDEKALADVLASLSDIEGTGYDQAAVDEILRQIPEAGFPDLPEGEKPAFRQMTFTLHDDQAEVVKRALERAKALGPFVDTQNENANGNALARICELFLGTKPTAKDIRVAPIRAEAANALVRRVHYSWKVVQNSQLHLGVFLDGRLEGAMQFGTSLDKRKLIGLVEGTRWNEFIELNRMAFSEALPRNSESRALGVAMRLIRKHYPQLKWVVSFADGTHCGDATIYRASGFVLTGITSLINLALPRMGGHPQDDPGE